MDNLDLPWQKVVSSNIAAIAYQPETRTMYVKFTKGRVYSYSPITADAHKELLAAESIGSHFNTHFRGNTNITVKEL